MGVYTNHHGACPNRAQMVPRSVRIHCFRMLSIRDQGGKRLRFVLGTNTFWHNGAQYTYSDKKRLCLYTNARERVKMDRWDYADQGAAQWQGRL
jgi:hypothetical protein